MKKNNNKGFSMVELMIVLAVIAFMVVAVVTVSKVVWGKTEAAQMETDISNIAQDIHTTYSAQGGEYTNLDTKTVIDMGIVPANMLVGETGSQKIVTPWYSKQRDASLITIAENSTAGFDVDITGVPAESCTDIATHFMKQEDVSIGDTKVSDVSSVSSECAKGGELNKISINFF